MKLLITLVLSVLWLSTYAQQVADTSFKPEINDPEYNEGEGPLIILDEAHNNFHKLEERFYSFGKVMRMDGYRIESGNEAFSEEFLKPVRILVIANAIHISDMEDWALPQQSAFTDEEIQAVNQWVKDGGRLFLIADHMPFPGAAEKLGASFGFEMVNGFAMREPRTRPDKFSRENGLLQVNEITEGRKKNEKINTVSTFTGQGFKIPEGAESIITLDDHYYSLNPDTAWQFHKNTPKIDLDGYSQGAYMNYGKGKVVVFGEAAMFTTQIAGKKKIKMGMNSKAAPENLQFLRNIIHWLDKDVQ